MPKIAIEQVAIGYIDSEGYAYCLKHGLPGMEKVYQDESTEQCAVCGVNLNDPVRSY